MSRVPDNYLGYIARQVAGNSPIVDDLIQEGRIKVWGLESKYPGKPMAFYAKAAKRRMIDVAHNGNPMTGESPHVGHIDVLSDKPTVSLSAPVGEYDTELGSLLAEELAERHHAVPELAYHRAEIREVLKLFPESQRHYIFCRFWLGWTRGQLESEGMGCMDDYWHRKAKSTLATKLAHLKGLA